MDNNLELNAVGTFNLAFSDQAGSVRRKTATPFATRHELSIKRSAYTDSATKVTGNRVVVRFDKYSVIDATGTIAPVSAYVVFAVPNGSVDLTTVVQANMAAITQLLGTQLAADTQHNKVVNIVMGGEQ